MSSQPSVTTDPGVCGGRPCFAARVPLDMVLRRLDAGESLVDLQEVYSSLTAAHIAAARAYAAS